MFTRPCIPCTACWPLSRQHSVLMPEDNKGLLCCRKGTGSLYDLHGQRGVNWPHMHPSVKGDAGGRQYEVVGRSIALSLSVCTAGDYCTERSRNVHVHVHVSTSGIQPANGTPTHIDNTRSPGASGQYPAVRPNRDHVHPRAVQHQEPDHQTHM